MKRLQYLAAVLALAACGTASAPDAKNDRIETDGYVLGNLDYPVTQAARRAPFSRGINMPEWFQSSTPQSIPFTKFSEETFVQVKGIGVEAVRLPINLHSFFKSGSAGAYTPDPLFFSLLDQVVDWAEKHEIYLILDNHTFDPVASTTPSVRDVLIPVWTHMAEHFKGRGKYVLYEVLNEPHGDGITAEQWGAIQGDVISAIRSKDTVHTIIVGGINYNSIGSLAGLPEYADDNLIYTFHFYDPYVFTHQGENWGAPPNLANLKGVPFPAEAHKMPEIPKELRSTGYEDTLKNQYAHDGDPKTLAEALDKAAEFSNARGAPVFCGEFGVYMLNSFQTDRARWYTAVTKFLDERGIARTSWDYYGSFGVFKKPAGGDFYSDLNVEVVRAMGFTPPEQRPPESIRDGFVLYDDYPRNGASVTCWANTEGTLFSVYDTDAADGAFNVLWKNPQQYQSFFFTFAKGIDWALLRKNGFALRFKAKADAAASFDVRFIDVESASSIPWRLKFSIDATVLPPDGKWHTVTIPLSKMVEQGAWVNATETWYNPDDKFSWGVVEKLEFASEVGSIAGSLCFDSIEIVKN